jgi:hemoglobin-like flavoprotein
VLIPGSVGRRTIGSMITDTQIAAVQSSFQRVLPIADQAGMLFYGRVFELAPATRAMFGPDIELQATRTMAALRTAVEGLDRLDEVGPMLVRLGARHVRYGVRPEHFDVVGEALMWTLEQGLGDALTPPVREAWSAAWALIRDAMETGMRRITERSELELTLAG